MLLLSCEQMIPFLALWNDSNFLHRGGPIGMTTACGRQPQQLHVECAAAAVPSCIEVYEQTPKAKQFL